MSARLKRWVTRPWFIAVVLGVAAGLYAIPLEMLDPTNIGWMNRKDTIAHWVGWEHFRHSPVWQFPLGKSELYGLERSSSIVFSDSIPLVALALHPFERLLPTPFQYLGLWTLACFVLQAYFAFRLLSLVFARPAGAAAATALFLVSAPMLNRMHFQTSLVSHWLVLAALLFYFNDARDWRWRRWAGLLLVASLVHGYLFVMVAFVWFAHLAKVAVLGGLRGGPPVVLGAAARAALVMAACGVTMWCVGYFGVPAANLRWFGQYRFDLMSPICSFEAWSRIFPDVRCGGGVNDWEGLSFLGIGTFAALAAALVGLALVGRPAPRSAALPRWPLVIACLALAVFAASNQVVIGGREAFSYHLPPRLLAIAETFRGSGRMIWPAFYAGMFAILALFARVVPSRLHLWILVPAALLQAYDVQPGIRSVHARLPPTHDYPELHDLQDPAWRQLAQYRKLVEVPAVSLHDGWQDVVWQAAKSGVGTNAGYSNRAGPAAAAVARATLRSLVAGAFDRDTVYLIFEKALWDAIRELKGPGDVALVADGYHLLFPGGARLGLVDSAVAPTPALPLGQWRGAGKDQDGAAYLTNGWSWAEPWGRWSDADVVGLTIPQPEAELGEDRTVVLDVMPYTTPALRAQRYRIFAWSTLVAEGKLEMGDSTIELVVPGKVNARRSLFLEIDLPDAAAAADTRLLGLGLRRVWLSAEPGTAPPTPQAAALAETPPPDAYWPLQTWRALGDQQPGERAFLDGWSWPESWGRWSAQRKASVAVVQPDGLGLPTTIQLDVVPYTTKEVPTQRVRVSVAGTLVSEETVAEAQVITFTVPASLTGNRTIVLDLELPDAVESSDGRILALGLRRMSISRAAGAP